MVPFITIHVAHVPGGMSLTSIDMACLLRSLGQRLTAGGVAGVALTGRATDVAASQALDQLIPGRWIATCLTMSLATMLIHTRVMASSLIFTTRLMRGWSATGVEIHAPSRSSLLGVVGGVPFVAFVSFFMLTEFRAWPRRAASRLIVLPSAFAVHPLPALGPKLLHSHISIASFVSFIPPNFISIFISPSLSQGLSSMMSQVTSPMMSQMVPSMMMCCLRRSSVTPATAWADGLRCASVVAMLPESIRSCRLPLVTAISAE